MKLLLTSAGIRNQAIADALATLTGKPLTECSIIHIPTAANTELGDKTWVIDDLNQLRQQRFASIDLLDLAAVGPEVWQPRLRAADIISVGGGNEIYLSHVFDKIGMKAFLEEALQTRVYMGTSAGSMVAGQFLDQPLIDMIYSQEPAPPTGQQHPLGFYSFAFVPHLNNAEWFPHVRVENLERLKGQFTHPVHSTDDETALTVVDGVVQVIGQGAHWSS